jgi:hypothetical protein
MAAATNLPMQACLCPKNLNLILDRTLDRKAFRQRPSRRVLAPETAVGAKIINSKFELLDETKDLRTNHPPSQAAASLPGSLAHVVTEATYHAFRAFHSQFLRRESLGN